LWATFWRRIANHIDRALALYIQKLEHMRENLRTRQLQEEFEHGADLASKLRRRR